MHYVLLSEGLEVLDQFAVQVNQLNDTQQTCSQQLLVYTSFLWDIGTFRAKINENIHILSKEAANLNKSTLNQYNRHIPAVGASE